MTRKLTTLLLAALLAPGAVRGFERGANDFRVSDMGPNGDPDFDASRPAVAYNSVDHEYLVVWSGDDDRDGQVNNEQEIFIQRIDAATGLAVGFNDRRISTHGGLGIPGNDAIGPAVAYSPDANHYLVVWEGITGGSGSGIYGQRIDAAGLPVGIDDFLISDDLGSITPDVVYNPIEREYLVVWTAAGVPPLAPQETEVFVRRIDATTGTPLGSAPERISEMYGIGNDEGHALHPSVAFDPDRNRYLVAWTGNDDRSAHPRKFEIYGQLVDGVTGLPTGLDDVRVSRTGDDAESNQLATRPAVAYDPTSGQYLVAFQANLVPSNSDMEIYAQRIEPVLGLRVGVEDQFISDVSGAVNDVFGSQAPAALARPGGGFLVAWAGEHADLEDREVEIFGRFVGSGMEFESRLVRLSDMGGTGDASYSGAFPALAAGRDGDYLVAWEGDDDVAPLVDGEREIFGQLLATRIFADDFDSGDLSVWSNVVP